MTVRSTRLAATHGAAATWTQIFTCPAGWRAIVKSVFLDNGGGAATTINVVVTDPVTNANINFFVQPLAANSTANWSGWVVLYPGDYMQLYSSASVWDIWVSGTLLQLTGQEPL